MEIKYDSQHTSEQFNDAIKIVNNSWIQLEVTGGLKGDIITLSPGSKYILTNSIPSNPSWQASNVSYYRYVEDSTVQYPNYDLYILNNENSSTKTNSKITYTTNLVANHIYYFQAFVDGLNSNGVNHGIRIGPSSDLNTVYMSSYTTSIDAINLSCRGKILESNVNISLYASRDIAATSEVHFGRLSLVDLTYSFGEGNEPTKEWCDDNIDLYSPKGNYNSTILLDSNKTSFTDISVSLDDNGKCLVSLPGFDTWTPQLNSNYYFWDKYNITTLYRSIYEGSYSTSVSYAISSYYFASKTADEVTSSYFLNTSTGYYEVNQNTSSRTSTDASTGLFYISLSRSSGTQTGQEIRKTYKYTSSSSSKKLYYYKYVPESYQAAGNYIEHVYSTNPNAYPDNGIQGSYWYIRNNGLKNIVYDSLNVNEVKRYFLDVSFN